MVMFKIVAILAVLCLSTSISAEEKRSSLTYLKLGGSYSPGDASAILPSFGLGTRFQRNSFGCDLSANLSSVLFINYASVKGICLFYPQPEKRHQSYVGIGPGFGYYFREIPMGGSYGSASTQYGMATLEALLGYEFRHARHLKTFIQLELSQPLYNFDKKFYRPGLALTGGIGF